MTCCLIHDGVGFGDLVGIFLLHRNGQCFDRGRCFRNIPHIFRAHFGEVDDAINNRLECSPAFHDRIQHNFFGQFLGFGFNHQNTFFGSGNNQIKVKAGDILHRRVDDEFTVFVTNARRANRTHERDTGNGEGGRTADQGDDVWIVFQIMRYDGCHNLHFVEEVFREERADWAVDQTGSQRFFLRWTGFALEEATRDFTGGVCFFLIMDGKGEEILAFLD